MWWPYVLSVLNRSGRGELRGEGGGGLDKTMNHFKGIQLPGTCIMNRGTVTSMQRFFGDLNFCDGLR